MHTFLYVVVGLPITVVLTGELLITLNEAIIAEQANYRLQSDFDTGIPFSPIEVPGPKHYRKTDPPKSREEFNRHLVELYSPVIYHKVSSHPEWDIPLFIDYDGTPNPRDNVINEPKFRPHVAGVYGEVTAITEDSIYLTYSLYHVKDYDHPIREKISSWTYHDNDNEGFHIRVDAKTGRLEEVETWFHNRFLLFNHTGVSKGTEPVHGRIYTENKTHVIVYAQPQGHGIRLVQQVDLPSLNKRVKILRYRYDSPAVPIIADASVQVDGTYELRNFDRWYAQAQGPFGKNGEGEGLFESVIPLHRQGEKERYIGRFIGGKDYAIGSWSRPKPMWSWDDGWDEIPVLVWHFFPSMSFASHGGTNLSHVYLYNRPCERVYGQDAATVLDGLALRITHRRGDKWKKLHGRGGQLDHASYWEAFNKSLKTYVNYVFHALG